MPSSYETLPESLRILRDASDYTIDWPDWDGSWYNESRSGRSGSRVKAFRWIRVGSWNVGSLTSKLLKLVDALESSHTTRNGVGVIWRACLKDKAVHMNRCSDRIISVTLVIEGETINVISAYVPQVRLSGDLNGHIGATTIGHSGVHGGFGYGVRNEDGCSILDFAIAHDLAVVNSSVGSAAPRILWKNLNGDAMEVFRLRVSEGVSTQIKAISASDTNSMWNFLACIIKDAAKDSLGVAMGTSKTHTAHRESWWLCVEVQSKVADKQERFRELLSCHEEKAYEDMYKKLDSKEGANEIFRIAKARQRRRWDLGDICFIKDEARHIVTDEEEFKQRWGE
ncbi:retrovirus-related pol polyprotein LINE-1, partial [Tanacetum coccineum]